MTRYGTDPATKSWGFYVGSWWLYHRENLWFSAVKFNVWKWLFQDVRGSIPSKGFGAFGYFLVYYIA